MLKKLALIVLIGISNIHTTDAPKTDFIQKVKNSPAIVKVVWGIIPCIMTFISMNDVIKTYKDNPEWHTIADIAYYIKLASLAMAFTFCNLLMRINLINWLLSPCKNNVSIASSKFNTPDSILLQKID